ncbi:PIN domain-containing protein [Thermococcus pacificus]|uniref:PIN domain-containing protein n=1 Tax=Thermococcus pacificus TaxID=71998 RepID=UPI000B59A5CC
MYEEALQPALNRSKRRPTWKPIPEPPTPTLHRKNRLNNTLSTKPLLPKLQPQPLKSPRYQGFCTKAEKCRRLDFDDASHYATMKAHRISVILPKDRDFDKIKEMETVF